MLFRLTAIFALFAASAAAQTTAPRENPGATVSGVVRDSIANAPLADATVQLIASDDPARFERTTTSDSLGRFILRDVPLGRYMLGFFHPVLDSLGVEAPLREVNVDSFGGIIADVAIPGPKRLRAAICGGQSAADSGGVIIGAVRDVSGAPIAAATVEGQWLELSLGRGGLSRRIARATATTTQAGWFSLCDIPSVGTIALTAAHGADSTGMIEIELPAGGLLRRELFVGKTSAEVVNVAPKSSTDTSRTTRRILVGNTRLSGIVVTSVGGRPLADAQVTIVNGPQARTNERGEFTITNAPGGTRMIEVRALGYFPATKYVDIVPNARPIRVPLSTFKAVLDTVRIIASRLPNGPDGGGFQRRQRTGMGRFITAADMATHPVVNTTDVFRRVPGVRVDSTIKLRGAFEEWCDAAVFLDGAYMHGLTAEDVNDWVFPQHVAGIEVYTESNVPPQFQVGLGGCGSIVIWTK